MKKPCPHALMPPQAPPMPPHAPSSAPITNPYSTLPFPIPIDCILKSWSCFKDCLTIWSIFGKHVEDVWGWKAIESHTNKKKHM